MPGFGSSASAVLSPLILLPTFLVPLSWVYTAIILLKINVAFWFAYFWLREERLGKIGAAVGAVHADVDVLRLVDRAQQVDDGRGSGFGSHGSVAAGGYNSSLVDEF